MKFQLNQEQLNNLLVFLDRVDYKGIKEVKALNDILNALSNPINDNEE